MPLRARKWGYYRYHITWKSDIYRKGTKAKKLYKKLSKNNFKINKEDIIIILYPRGNNNIFADCI